MEETETEVIEPHSSIIEKETDSEPENHNDDSNTFQENNDDDNTLEQTATNIVQCSCCANSMESNPIEVKQEIFDEGDIEEEEDVSEPFLENSSSPFPKKKVLSNSKSIKTSRDQIKSILEVIFEYPYITRQEKTIFGQENNEDFPLCSTCLDVLHALFPIYCEFTNLLKQEGRIWKTIWKIGFEHEPILPMLVYADQDNLGRKKKRNARKQQFKNLTDQCLNSSPQRRSNRKAPRNEQTSQKDFQSNYNDNYTNEIDTSTALLPRLRPTRKINKKLSTKTVRTERKIRIKLYSEDEESSSAHNSEDEDGEQQELQEFYQDDLIGFSDCDDDGNFKPTTTVTKSITSRPKKRLGGGSKLKESLVKKARGRPPKQRLTSKTATKSTTQNNESEQASTTKTASNDEVQPVPTIKKKKKRIRPNRKKEIWIQKAKNDPSRTCNVCGKSFFCARFMQHHRATVHEGKRPYECDYCGKAFTQKFIVKKHLCDYSRCTPEERDHLIMVREQKLRTYACDMCDKRFKEKCHLNVHKLNHREDRPFECQVADCDKTFRRKDHLRMHVRVVHTLERQFVCALCGKSFKLSSNLRAHEKRHRPSDEKADEKHICTVCGKAFDSISLVNRHQMTHEEYSVLPYACPICGKRFKMKDYLGQHLRKGKTCKLPKKTNLTTLLARVNSSNNNSSNDQSSSSFPQQALSSTSDLSSPPMADHAAAAVNFSTTSASLVDPSKDNSNNSQSMSESSSTNGQVPHVSNLPAMSLGHGSLPVHVPAIHNMNNMQFPNPYHQSLFDNPYRTH